VGEKKILSAENLSTGRLEFHEEDTKSYIV
jgi:hypothetical protein